jgi:hypothetical protein
MYNTNLPLPIACGMVGALAGLIGGAFNNCFPVWVGAATGGSLGCVMCVVTALMPERAQIPVAQVVSNEPRIVIQNIYIITGSEKTVK